MERGTEDKDATRKAMAVGRGPKGYARKEDTEWLRTMAQLVPVGIFRADADGRCIYVNARWCEMTGIPVESALGVGWKEAIHPDDRDWLFEAWEKAATERVRFDCEYRYLRTDGRVVWVFGQATEDVDEKGKVVGFVGTVTDVTELRRMREALARSYADLEVHVHERTQEIEHMALVVEGSDDAIIRSRIDGGVVGWNKAAQRIFGYTAEEMQGQTSLILTPPQLRDEALALKTRSRAGEAIYQHETVRVAKSGQIVDVSISLFPLWSLTGEITGTCAIVRDITQRRTHERRLHKLSWRLMRAQDQERRYIARELHDSTAQLLAALTMNLAALGCDSCDGERREMLIADSAKLAEEAARELRTRSYLLHPPLLDERGLPSALRVYLDGFSARSGIAVEADIDSNFGRLGDDIELTIFRVVQECLTNVMRHAGSATARVELRVDPPWLTLKVSDAGRGLDPKNDPEGVGIHGMKERLLQLGGSLDIESSGQGTTILARIPIPL